MRILYLMLCLMITCVLSNHLQAQDTLLYENFEEDPVGYIPSTAPTGTDMGWINFDLDGLADANGRPQDWYWSEDFTDTLNSVMASSSWLASYLPGNRNYLILPPLEIVDNTAMISWKSAPLQGPRYVDGYSVMVSTTTNIETDFTIPIHQSAQMIEPLGTGLDANNYVYSSGDVFASFFTDSALFYLDAPTDNSYACHLESWEYSLAAFEGETIYIAFIHDADDDNAVSVDDIMVTGTMPEPPPPPSGLGDLQAGHSIKLWPNPVLESVNISLDLNGLTEIDLALVDGSGRLVRTILARSEVHSEASWTLSVDDLPPGMYGILVRIGDRQVFKPFSKL